MTSNQQKQPRFLVLIGGGIGECHDAKQNLTFKQAVRAWVAGQKVCPTDCVIGLETDADWEDEANIDWQTHDALEEEVIARLVEENREWVEKQILRQDVYNLGIMDYRNPFTRG
jgi:hypothetical protein